MKSQSETSRRGSWVTSGFPYTVTAEILIDSPRTSELGPLAPYPLPLTPCHLPLATCHLPLATCHLPLARPAEDRHALEIHP
jgi:hypothetical protein